MMFGMSSADHQLGLAAVPFLPLMFDQPVEHATEWVFHKAFATIGGPGAVGHGSTHDLADKIRAKKHEKEL